MGRLSKIGLIFSTKMMIDGDLLTWRIFIYDIYKKQPGSIYWVSNPSEQQKNQTAMGAKLYTQ